MTAYLAGHLGSRVSALVDAQMSADEADRAWAHVHTCQPCYDLVGREGWVKAQLAGLSRVSGCSGEVLDDAAGGAPASLKGALAGFTPASVGFGPVAAPITHHRPPTHGATFRPVGLMALGGGALGAAMLGVLALGAAPTGDPTLHQDVVAPSRTTTVGVSPTGPIEPVSLERPRAVGVIAYVTH